MTALSSTTRRSLKIRLATLSETDRDTAASYNNLGSAYDSEGEYDRAIEYHEQYLQFIYCSCRLKAFYK